MNLNEFFKYLNKDKTYSKGPITRHESNSIWYLGTRCNKTHKESHEPINEFPTSKRVKINSLQEVKKMIDVIGDKQNNDNFEGLSFVPWNTQKKNRMEDSIVLK